MNFKIHFYAFLHNANLKQLKLMRQEFKLRDSEILADTKYHSI